MHYPESMRRMNKLRKESKNPEVSGGSVMNGFTETGNQDTEKNREADEKAAAKMFPLNLISAKFRPSEPEILKGISMKLIILEIIYFFFEIPFFSQSYLLSSSSAFSAQLYSH